MPTISIFFGIIIQMFFNDVSRHHAPHVHAKYQEHDAVYSIHDGAILAGSLPPRKHKMVVKWIKLNQEDLMANWELALKGMTPFKIQGLNQK